MRPSLFAPKRRRSIWLVWPACIGLALAAPAARAACVLPNEAPMLIVTFYFGENIPNQPMLTAAQWADFAAQTITPAFPEGLTVADGQGQWMNPKTGAISNDPTKIVTIAVKDSPGLAAKISAVIASYKTKFHQESVGLTTADGCGAF